jgi:hypothetical protein
VLVEAFALGQWGFRDLSVRESVDWLLEL